MKNQSLKWITFGWVCLTSVVLVLLLMLDISRQRQTMQLEGRALYEFSYERTLVNEVLLHNLVELIENDYQDSEAIARYAQALREHYPHIRRLQLYQRVELDAVAEHEAAMRDRGFANYRVQHTGQDGQVASATGSGDSNSIRYPLVFVDPFNAFGIQLLGKDAFSIEENRRALIQASYYLSVFATDPYPLEDGSMGYRLVHAIDPVSTGTDEVLMIAALVLDVAELLPPLSQVQAGVAVSLLDSKGKVLANRNKLTKPSAWALPSLNERRKIIRFGQELEILVEKQFLWRDSSWSLALVLLLFSLLSYLFTRQGIKRKLEAESELLLLNEQLIDERDLLEQRVMERTDELVKRNSELRNQIKENRSLVQQVLDIQENERRNIARELHDEMGQALTAVRTDSRLLMQLTDRDKSSLLYTAAAAIDSTAQQIYSVTYGLMRSLRPTALDDLGLVDALNQCVDSFGFEKQHIKLHRCYQGSLNELSEPLAIQCFRIVQESLNNCSKYAQANNIWLTVTLEEGSPNWLRIRVEDDGIGFEPLTKQTGFGLIGLRERALAHGGRFDLDSKPGKGARIEVEIPVQGLEPGL